MAPKRTIIHRLCLTCGICCNGTLFRDVELQPGEDVGRFAELGLPLQWHGRRKRPLPSGHPLRHCGVKSKGSCLKQPSASSNTSAKITFPQPCAALGSDLRCGIYGERPAHCRDFECALFKAVAVGQKETTAAQHIIHKALRLIRRIHKALAQLEETRESVALRRRFQRLQRRLERRRLGAEEAHKFAQLSLMMHELQFLLRREFYPDPND